MIEKNTGWNYFSETFLIHRRKHGILGIVEWFRELFTGRQPIDKVVIGFYYCGDVEPEVFLHGLQIVQVKSDKKTLEEV